MKGHTKNYKIQYAKPLDYFINWNFASIMSLYSIVDHVYPIFIKIILEIIFERY